MTAKMIFFFLFFVFFTAYSQTQSVYYQKLDRSSSGIDIFPQPGVYAKDTEVCLSSNIGTIFYKYDNNLGTGDFIPYTKPFLLKYQKGFAKEYRINIILEMDDGRIEFVSANYLIDGRGNIPVKISSVISMQDRVNIRLINDFDVELSPVKGVLMNLNDRKIIIGSKDFSAKSVIFKGREDFFNEYIVGSLIYDGENRDLLYEYRYLDKKKPLKPEFGSVWWGQVYKQDEKIEIRNPNNSGDIYYWMKEWGKDEVISGPPLISDSTRWNLYKEPINLSWKDSAGVVGISGFIKDKDKYSDIQGPFYIKKDVDNNSSVQSFNEKNVSDTAEENREIFVNGESIKNKYEIVNSDTLEIKFQGFKENDFFIFEYETGDESCKSSLMPCSGMYNFENKLDKNVAITFKMSDNRLIGVFYFGKENHIVPIPDGYQSDYIEATSDRIIDFYMPKSNMIKQIKYGISYSINDFTNVDEKSPDFKGKVFIKTDGISESNYKLRIVSFDTDNNILDEKSYIFHIDKKMPEDVISIKNYNEDMVYNTPLVVEIDDYKDHGIYKVYYQFNNESDWFRYDGSFTLTPPLTDLSDISLKFKVYDKAGNEMVVDRDFVFHFDRRAIFVDSDMENCGNGTNKFPVNSIERAIKYASEKNIKIINVISDYNKINKAININSDIVIQPYNKNNFISIQFELKSIFEKDFTWFNVFSGKYFDLRNCEILIDTGSILIGGDRIKTGIYNSTIDFLDDSDFTIFKTTLSYQSLKSTTLNVPDRANMVTIANSIRTKTFVYDLTADMFVNKACIFKISDDSDICIDKSHFDFSVDKDFTYIDGDRSNFVIKDTGIDVKTKDGKLNIFRLKKAKLAVDKCLMNIKNSNGFNNNIFDFIDTESNISMCQSFINGGNDTIGFNLKNSNLNISRSIFSIENNVEYSYLFRCADSKVYMDSTILKNVNSSIGINVMLNDSDFNGVNNSFFVINSDNRAFNFWINGKSLLTTINSVYYIDHSSHSDKSFIYTTNNEYFNANTVWLANIVSTGIITYENFNKKDYDFVIEDFIQKNIYQDLTDTFDTDKVDFFIPLTLEQIGEFGIGADKSPIVIPKVDFYGNQRILHDYGIDIGAVQLSGNKRYRLE